MSFFSLYSNKTKLIIFRVKEVLFTLLCFLMVTMSLFHVFFERYSQDYLDHKKTYKPIIDNRNNGSLNLLINFDKLMNEKYEGDSIAIFSKQLIADYKKHFNLYQNKLKTYTKEKKKIAKKHSFRGRTSFHFWLYVFGIVSALFFFSIKSLYDDLINSSNYKFQFISLTGICISIFWFIHLIVFTKTDISKNNYAFLIIFCVIFFGIFGYYSIKHVAKIKLRKKMELEEAFVTIKNLKEEVLFKQEEKLEKERQRISEELHDGILGKLFGTRINLGFLDIANDYSKEKYQKFLDELKEIENEIREVSHKLRVNINNPDVGFTDILKQLIRDKSIIGNFNYSLKIDAKINWKDLNEVDKVNLYRIAQEILQNIIKHSKAKNVKMLIREVKNDIIIEIIDNGIGFKVLEQKKKGIGLNNIKSRIKRLKGDIVINSNINDGTKVIIKIPYLKRLVENHF